MQIKDLPVHTVHYVPASAIFQATEDEFPLGMENKESLSIAFSERCSNITYGDASYTMIAPDAFLEILRDILHEPGSNIFPHVVDEFITNLRDWLRVHALYVDLEN